MEEIRSHHTPESSEPTSDASKEKKKSKKKARFPLSDIAKLEQSKPAPTEAAKPTALEAALANLATEKKDKKPEETTDHKPERLESATAHDETSTAESDRAKVEDTAETKTDAEPDEEVYEALTPQELKEVDLSGGEVVIHLNGDEAVSERVLPVETVSDTDDAEQTPSESDATSAEAAPESGDAEEEPTEQTLTTPVAAAVVPPPLPKPASQPNQPPTPYTNRAVPVPTPNTGGGGNGNIPPTINPLLTPNPNNPNVPQHNGYVAPAVVTSPNTVATSANVLTQRDVDEAEYYGRKAGMGQGLLTGLFLGGSYEHFKHRRREKKAEKQQKAQAKQLEALRTDMQFNEQERTAEQSKHARQLRAAETQSSEPESQPTVIETRPNSLMVPTAEVPMKRPEHGVIVQEEEQQLQVAEGHHLETSAWHTIEVDNKTGKAVETPAFTYGREYYRERAQESTPAAQRSAAAGGVAVAGMASTDGTDSGATPSAPTVIPSASMQGRPLSKTELTRMQKLNDVKDSITNEAVWPWAVALVVIILVLVVVLR